MLIVDRKTFMAMPAGTVFAKYEPCNFGELTIKEDTIGDIDFCVQGIIPCFVDTGDTGAWIDTLTAAENGTPTPPLDYDICGRDGLFDADQLFAVFERHDVEALIARLGKCLESYSLPNNIEGEKSV